MLKLAVFIASGFFGLLELKSDAVDLNEDQRARLRFFIAGQGFDSKLIQGFENEAFQTMVTQLGSPEFQYRRMRTRQALLEYLIDHPGEIRQDIAKSARNAVYAGLSANDPDERESTARIVGQLEGEAGLGSLRPLFHDPEVSVRFVAIAEYATHGSVARIAELEAVVEERTRGKSLEEITHDSFVKYARDSIEKLKKRWSIGVAPVPAVPPLGIAERANRGRGEEAPSTTANAASEVKTPASRNAANLSESQKEALSIFVASDGANPELIEGFKNEAIEELIASVGRAGDRYVRSRTRKVLLRYLVKHPGEVDQGVAKSARDAVYAGLSAEDSGERMSSALIVGQCEGDASLDLLRPLLRDPAENVRVAAIGQFAVRGSNSRIAELQEILKERTEGKSAEEISRDLSIEFARKSLEKLKKRWDVGLEPSFVVPASGNADQGRK